MILSLAVGGLEVLGDCQGDVDRQHRLVVGHLQLLDQLLGGQSLALDPLHLGLEELLADAVGQVGLPELALLPGQPSAIDLGALNLLAGDTGQLLDVHSDG